MGNLAFFISWILASLMMFAASYLWHGVFLTDFSKLNYPLGVFLTIACFVYLLLGFILTKAFDLKLITSITRKPIPRGLIAGAGLGLVIFAVTTVTGVSFSYQLNFEYMLLDLSWQILEQALGGIVVGLVQLILLGSLAFQD